MRELTEELGIIKDSFTEMKSEFIRLKVPNSVGENRSKSSKAMDNFQTWRVLLPTSREEKISHKE